MECRFVAHENANIKPEDLSDTDQLPLSCDVISNDDAECEVISSDDANNVDLSPGPDGTSESTNTNDIVADGSDNDVDDFDSVDKTCDDASDDHDNDDVKGSADQKSTVSNESADFQSISSLCLHNAIYSDAEIPDFEDENFSGNLYFSGQTYATTEVVSLRENVSSCTKNRKFDVVGGNKSPESNSEKFSDDESADSILNE